MVTSVLYDLPVGRGKLLNINNSIANAIIGGWQAGGILTLQTGMPGTLTVGGVDNASTGAGGYDRPNVTGVDPYLNNPTPSRYWNLAAFAEAPPGQFGNAGRNSIEGPGIIGFDAEVHKRISYAVQGGTCAAVSLRSLQRSESPELANAELKHSVWGGATGNAGDSRPSELRSGHRYPHRHAPDPIGT